MRILHITDDISTEASGISSYLKNLLPLLESENVETYLYSPPSTGARFESHLSRWASRRHYQEVRRLLCTQKPAIVHAHSLSLRLSPLVLRAAREASIPVIATVHDFNYVCPRKWLQRTGGQVCSSGFGLGCLVRNCPTVRSGWHYLPYQDARWLKIALHRKMLRRWVDLFLCPTRILADYMQKAFRNSRVACLPNFTSRLVALTPAWAIPNRILFVGRLSRDKGVDSLIKAMPIVLASCPEADLTLVGDGPERGALERLAVALGVAPRVHFKGLVEHSALADYYGAATVCVLPSSWMENCPISGLEALAAGRPVVGSAIGGISEIVEDEVTGFLVRVGDFEALAKGIVRLLVNPDLVRSLGEEAGKVFERRYSPETHVKQLLILYESALAASGRSVVN